MPAEANANIDKSFLPPPPIERTVGPEFAEPVPAVHPDWTTSGPQTASQIAAGAKGERNVVSPENQRIRREAAGG